MHGIMALMTGGAVVLAAAAAAPAAAADTVDISFQVESDWGSGFQGKVTITNHAGWSIPAWQLGFAAPWSVTSIWNAQVLSHSGSQYVIADAGADIGPGATVSFGWIGAPGGAVPPAAGTLNGVPVSLNGASPAPPPPAPAPAPAWPTRWFSPFVDATLWPLFDLAAYRQNEDVRFVALGFVVAVPGTCEPAWGGFQAYSVASLFRLQEINAVRAAGGDVMVSFGGAAGTELALACPTVESVRAAYRQTIDTYGLTHVDFDIEGAAAADPPSIARRSQAIRLLQLEAAAAGRELRVSLTLPVLPSGLTADGLAVVQSALAAGVELHCVNIMAMDYGPAAAPDPDGHMGDYAIQAATSLHAQLAATYAAAGQPLDDAEVWHRIGVTPMLGVNDVVQEVFTLADAAQVRAFAEEKGLRMLAFWDAQRDRPCDLPPPAQPNNFCSGIPQAPWAFTSAWRTFTPVPGDLDGSGSVNGADLGLMLAAWGAAGGPADLDGSGSVDGADLGILLSAWSG